MKNGVVFLSLNARAFRLLLPKSLEQELLRETFRAPHVVVSRGPWTGQGNRDSIEIMFDDGSDDPYSLHLDARQCAPLPAAESHGESVDVSLWVNRKGIPTCVRNYPGWFRVVDSIPCLKPWKQ
jgi:hypothetical protein